MFGIELIEFISFGKQIGIVVAGAASLWGLVFLRSSKEVAAKLLLPVFLGTGISFVFWFLLINLLPAYAHEGITLRPTLEGTYRALTLFTPLSVAWFALSLGGLLWWRLRKASFLRVLPWFLTLELACALILVSFPSWFGEWGREQLFSIGHSVHSIFTLGTVITLDYLFLISQRSIFLQRQIFPKFSAISKVIWLGLGIDFLSVALVFQEALQLTPKFFFMQTVIGILIVNGVLLAGPIARQLQASLGEGGLLAKKWKLAGNVAGVISISSWSTITFVDFFHNMKLEYYQFLGLYFALIIFLFCAHSLLEASHRRRVAVTS